MAATLFFIFKHNNQLYIVDNTKVDTVPKPRELIRRTSTIEQIREIASTMNMEIASDTARERTRKHTEEGRKRIAEAKMGDKHPARIHGQSDEHRRKISETMTGTRQGENNPMHGRKHSLETRAKMSEKRRLRGKSKLICGPDGVKKIPIDEPIPEGWHRGTKYDPYRPTDLD